jgi:hypothetical protein
MMPARKITVIALGSLLLLGGCGHVERQMTIQSNPTGAVVYLNNEEVGRTPCTVDFTWYGRYDLIIRKDGYESLKTTQQVTAPWWQWIPLDFAAEVIPGRKQDHRQFAYTLTPETTVAPAVLADRAASLKPMLESGQFTRKSSPVPATQPATQPATTQP